MKNIMILLCVLSFSFCARDAYSFACIPEVDCSPSSVFISPKAWVGELKHQERRLRNPDNIKYYRDHFNNYSEDRVIKKWASPIRINESEDIIIKEQTSKVVKLINDLIKVDVSVVSSGSNVNIHVYPTKKLCSGYFCPTSSIHAFKTGWPRILYTHKNEDDYRDIFNVKERNNFVYLRDATLFTEESTQKERNLSLQVEGLIASNKNHNIFYSECYIYKNHPEKIKRILTTECILRVLGMPNVEVNKKSIFYKRRSVDDFNYTDIIGDYDKALIKMLYDDRIRSGFTLGDINKIFGF